MYKRFVKRFLDLCLAIIAMPFCIVVWIAFAPFIYFEDKGTVFYTAQRIGKNQEVYKMYKLRSMKMNATDIRNPDGSTYNSKDDPRVTRVGRCLRSTSLDETGQIINIIKGDMSWIGPRPATPLILDDLTDLQAVRFQVRPGITGYTQMMYRNSAQGEKRYESDKYYVEHLSFGLDVKIVLGTIARVLRKTDIYTDSSIEEKRQAQ
ncbi:MAG: sugar transferase [Clostridia bacterium]|nr:sugar transferase [Clostridia bacterium]